MAHATQPIAGYHSGDSLRLHITVEDPDGNAVDIRDAEVTFAVAENESSTTLVLEKTVSGGGIAITDGQAGELVVDIQPEDTAALAGTYPYEVELSDTTGDVATVLSGTMEITADIIE